MLSQRSLLQHSRGLPGPEFSTLAPQAPHWVVGLIDPPTAPVRSTRPRWWSLVDPVGMAGYAAARVGVRRERLLGRVGGAARRIRSRPSRRVAEVRLAALRQRPRLGGAGAEGARLDRKSVV